MSSCEICDGQREGDGLQFANVLGCNTKRVHNDYTTSWSESSKRCMGAE